MWKKLIPAFILIIILISMGVFVLVQNKDKISNNTPENVQTSEKSEERIPEENVNSSEKEKEESMKFTISNQTFKIPIKYSDFIKTGFEIKSLRDSDYCNGYQKIYYIICSDSEGRKLPIDIENKSGNETDMKDCYVDGITITNDIPLLIDNINIWENSLEKMKEKYGEISGQEAVSDTETNYWWTFSNGYTLLTTFKNGKCIRINFGKK